MVKRAGLPNTNNFEFYVTLAAPLTFMDKNYVAFGRVVQGFKAFKKIEKIQLDINQKPETICKIDICGEYNYEEMKEYIKELEEAEKKEQEEMKLKEAEVEEARSEKKDDEEKKEEEVKENGDQNEGQMDIDDPEIIQLREQLSIEETVLGRIHIIFAIIEKFLSNFPLIEKYANAKFNIIDTDSNGVLSLSELAEFFNRDFDDKGWSKLGDRQAIMLMSRYDSPSSLIMSCHCFILHRS